MTMQRFKFQGGRLMTVYDGRSGNGWFPTEEEAREWARPKKRGEVSMTVDEFSQKILAPAVERLGEDLARIDWKRPWLSVKSDLAARGFTGTTKAEAIRWARERGMEVPE